jgi:hypothetical protein
VVPDEQDATVASPPMVAKVETINSLRVIMVDAYPDFDAQRAKTLRVTH